ncbi:MAG: hypothetical protein KGN80_02375, partial [Acidobacteriota bacterium]|nr:hypothetical protein [Acidobacteriota bacterium]
NTPPPPPPKTIADRLDYTNPTSGTYTLVKDTALSTSTHLVLNLMGPVGTQGTGVGFFLSADTSKVAWSKPSGSDAILAHNGAFDLGAAPQFAVAKNSGDQLQVGFYQKGATKPAVTFTASSVLASVALDLKSNVPVGASGNLSAIAGKAVLTQGSGAPVPITITPGTVTAN